MTSKLGRVWLVCAFLSVVGGSASLLGQSADSKDPADSLGKASAAGLRLTSEVVAVPLWLGASATVAASEVAGNATSAVWDASTSDSATRPKRDVTLELPPTPTPTPTPIPSYDESPAEAMKRKKEGKK